MANYMGGQQVQNAIGSLPPNLQWNPSGFGGGQAQQGGFGGMRGGGFNPWGGGFGGVGQMGPYGGMMGGGFGGGMGYGRAWPGQGFGGMPGRFGGAMGHPAHYSAGRNFGFGGGGAGFGFGGFPNFNFGPGSFNPYGAGMMGFGGGSGMMGGPMRPFTGGMSPPMQMDPANPAAPYQAQAQDAAGIAGDFHESRATGKPPKQTGGFKPAKPASGTKANPRPKKKKDRRHPAIRNWMNTERCCFVAGTKIRMADGSERNIEHVGEGMEVMGAFGESNVVLSFIRPRLGDRKLYSLNKGAAFVTAEHPFMTSKGWRSIDPEATAVENPDLTVEKLEVGDYIERWGPVMFGVTEIEAHDADPETALYNFELTGNHTYYADDFLVHNKAGDR